MSAINTKHVRRKVGMGTVLIRAVAVLALCGAAAQSAPPPVAYSWHNVVVGGGGFAPAIIFSPARSGRAWLRTDMGGAYRWDDDAGRWTPLQDREQESSYMGVESIAPDTVDPDTVYVAVGMYRNEPAAILRSHDAGASWDAARLPISMGGNEEGRGLGERLAVDPHDRRVLLFGSRHDGLWRSDDGAVSWRKDSSFVYLGKGAPKGWKSNGGIAFLVFDPRSGTRRIFAGVADPGAEGLYRSDDGGARWARVAGAPSGLLPVKASMDSAGMLYVSYSNAIGPNGITAGALWSLSPDGNWRDITPGRGKPAVAGGFMGISVDRTRPGALVVATIGRWIPIDTIWRTTDAGATWQDIGAISTRDVSATPFLKFGEDEAKFGHWITGLAIDPFNSERIAYTTGATVFVTGNGRSVTAMGWKPWTQGIEQTAIITLISPTGGAPLISGFGDLGGFVHQRLDRSPTTMFRNPAHANTNSLDYAGLTPSVIVRSGNLHSKSISDAGLAWSDDNGLTWHPLRTPEWGANSSREHNGEAPISVSADGERFYVGARRPWISTDRGAHWNPIDGLGGGSRIVADKVDPKLAWAIDHRAGRLLRSGDGGRHFAPVATRGACADLRAAAPRGRETPSALLASPFRPGELYLLCEGSLYRSADAGTTFARLAAVSDIALFGLGKGGQKQDTGIYLVTGHGAGFRILRSLDSGRSWQRIDNPAHRWGNRIRVISGDPNRVGRIYVGTDGRGIVYGDPN